MREGNTNQVWINNATCAAPPACQPQTHNIDTYWTGGCFIKVCNAADADKIHYYCGDHSAVASTVVSGKYESKWGAWPLIRHNPTTVPYEQPATVNYYAQTKVSGSTSNLCTGTRTFSVKNIAGATYSWTKSSSLTVVGSSNSYQYTVQRNGSSNGAAWVEVQISTPCSGRSVINRINFTVGVPIASNIIIWNSMSSTTVGHPVGFVAGYPPDNRCQLLSANWQVNMSANIVQGDFECATDNGTSKNIFFQSTGTALVNVKVQNACGWSDWSMAVPIQVNSGYYFMVSPNPATTTITINQRGETKDDISEIKIFDNIGNLKKQSKYGGGTKQAQLNISNLRSGVYFIEISGNKIKDRQQLVIQR